MATKKSITNILLEWFSQNARDLPWRHKYLPYHIWISEIMLQQTQMNRVVEYFSNWMKKFPDIEILAAANENDVIKAWEGLGYYSRVRNIHKTAQVLAHQHNGFLPKDYDSLLNLPGIGPYTAAAIMSLAFNEEYPVIDANVERVFSRLFNIAGPMKKAENKEETHKKAKKLLPRHNARNFNQAVMEFGALICKPNAPFCPDCPLQVHCESFRLHIVDKRPEKTRGKDIIHIDMVTGLLVHEGKVYIQKRLADDIWANLWEFAGGRIQQGESQQQAVVREYHEETEFKVAPATKITTVTHSYMNYRVTLHGYLCHLLEDKKIPVLHAAQEFKWIGWDTIDKYAFPAGHRKLIDFIKRSSVFHPLVTS